MSNEITGNVFNIQGYCIHDGPGIRTNIFLKGCPLKCLWCQNPESQVMKPEVIYYADRCVTCGKCMAACSKGAIAANGQKMVTDKSICDCCGDCVQVCKAEARSVIGEKISVSQIYEKIVKDKIFYDSSGGGITITGGEPLAQPAFSAAILQECKKNGIHTAIETCGCARWEDIEKVMQYTDLVLYDIKQMDSDEHKRCTGKSNERILQNLTRISKELQKPVIVRIPIVPGYNDSEENMHETGQFVKNGVPTCMEVNLLPYHSMGEAKREQMGKEPNDFKSRTPSEEELVKLKDIIASYGLKVI